MTTKLKKMRLDDLLVERGEFPNRDAALRAVMAREVRVDDMYATSAAIKVAPTADIFIRAASNSSPAAARSSRGRLTRSSRTSPA